MNRKNMRLTDEEMEIDWTDDEGNPTSKVTLTKSELYALLDAQICQLFPQPLDDKELREKLQRLWCQHCKAMQKTNETVVECWYNPLDDEKKDAFCAASCDAVDHLLALLQPKIEEAIKKERERILRVLKYLCKLPDGNYHISDKDWQALKGGHRG